MPRPALRSLLTLMLLILAVFSATVPAAAVDNGALGIRPSTESDFFHLALFPGAAADATAVVSNHTAQPVTLLTYPVDGQTTPQGSFAFASRSDPRKGIGAWVQLKNGQVTIPANTDSKVPFRLTVPPGTPPGDYSGGLIIQAPMVQGKTTTLEGGTAVRLNIVQRQGVRIYLKVAGTAIKSMSHGKLAWTHNDGNLNFTLPVTNTGNTILHPRADLSLTGWPESGTRLRFDAPENLLPGASINLHSRLQHAPVAMTGHAEAAITSEAGTGLASTNILYAPWLLLAIAIILIAATVYAIWRGVKFIRRARAALAQVGSSATATGSHKRTAHPNEPGVP